MVIKWKEREHSEEDELAIENERVMEALRNCCLQKFFLTPCIQAQLELLQYMVSIWDENQEKFILRNQELEIEVSDVYFITRLLRRGAAPILTNTWPCMENMTMVIDRVCQGERKGSGSRKFDIQTIPDLTLRVVLHTIKRAAGSRAPHKATKTQLLLVVYFLASTIYNWVEAMKINMKCQLTKCKKSKLKQFGYESILESFFLERLPIFQRQEVIVPTPPAREPRMVRWAALMPSVGGSQQMSWRPEFFYWLRQQLIVIED